MTQGTIWKQLIYFAFPLLIGNLFQQLYNTVDSVVVGNFVSTEALAAVGSVTPIINMLVGFFSGLATGAGVVISQFFGAKNGQMLHKAVHTTLLMTVGLGVIFTFIGIFMTPLMLNLMSTPADVFDGAALYLRIYFGGVLGLMLYNMVSGILRAVGDSKRPLYFLILSSLLNVVLDLAFVLIFHWGIAGVAIATIIAQFISAFLLLVVLARSDEDYKLVLRDLKMDAEILKRIVRIGLPAGLQMAVTSFSNVFVQSYINRFGSACMAGWTSYSKIDQFVLLPMQSLSLSATTFVGQNLGAGNLSRAKKGTRVSMAISVAITAVLTVLLIAFSSQLLMLFNQDENVLYYGNIFIRYLAPFYVICCINQIFAGSLRGAGDATGPMIIMLLSFVVFRQIYLFVGSQFFDSIIFVGLGYPAGWLVCSVFMAIHYFRGRWEKDYQIAK
ncbi:MAG TPA: MATE family efflux transporter [Candidatus Faecivivens stercoravium]|uniref:Probable multidrug resistance protein NorM n=1 Tax=Candidatus Faecivivens stercoravium TaxID=2840803 RepID=A0A9D1DXE6_9FIRM|nr:MATE family efflux transporter [Candidatus Faecivivens stercoravium]